ncbi:hypothetical protein QZH41_019051, partial [Actinostola sp. cb2023]
MFSPIMPAGAFDRGLVSTPYGKVDEHVLSFIIVVSSLYNGHDDDDGDDIDDNDGNDDDDDDGDDDHDDDNDDDGDDDHDDDDNDDDGDDDNDDDGSPILSPVGFSWNDLPSSHKGATGLVTVVDMFGFESSKINQLEQMCINLCSETLQHFYNTHIFKSSEEYCREEDICSDLDVDYVDNASCIELMTCQRAGIFTLLDAETAFA